MAAEPFLKFHTSPAIKGGAVELHKLANGIRLDIVGRDVEGRPLRLQTRHYTDLALARETAVWCAVVLCIPYKDLTGEPA